MIDEIILSGICSEKGIAINYTESSAVFSSQNIGKKIIATIKLEENYAEKERLYAYYYGPLLSAAVTGFTRQGYEGVDKVSADYMLSAELLKGFIKSPTGEAIPTILSKSKISKDRLLKYVQDCIFFIEANLETSAPDSLEWKTYKVTGRKLVNPSAKKG